MSVLFNQSDVLSHCNSSWSICPEWDTVWFMSYYKWSLTSTQHQCWCVSDVDTKPKIKNKINLHKAGKHSFKINYFIHFFLSLHWSVKMPAAVHLDHTVKRQQLVCVRRNHWDDTRDITAAITFLEFRKWREIKMQPDCGVALKSFNPCEGDWCPETETEAKGQR